MLKQFYAEWTDALSKEIIVSTEYDEKKVIIRQMSKIEFRGNEIQIHRKRTKNGHYIAEMFVTNTNKIIPGKTYPSKASCAAAILMALTPGIEKEERREKRAAAKAAEQIKEIMAERLATLDSKITMLANDRNWFCQFFNHNLQIGKYRNDNTLVDVLCNFYNVIAGDPMALTELDEFERRHHIDRMYESVCTAMARVKDLPNGEMILPKATVEYMYRNDLPAHVKLPQGILFVRNIFKQIDAFINHPLRFAYVMHTLRAYYEMRTGRTPDQILKAIEERKARAKERKLRRAEGYTDDGKFSIFNQRLTSPATPEPVSTSGDSKDEVNPDVLAPDKKDVNPDGLAPDNKATRYKVTPKPKAVKPQPKPKEHEPITNGMVSIGDVLGSALGDMDFGQGDEELGDPNLKAQDSEQN